MSISRISNTIIILTLSLMPVSAFSENSPLKSKELSRIIMESDTKRDDSYLYDRRPGMSKRLDWFSDVMSDRNDMFISQSRFDSIADDQSYGRRMLRRGIGREASRLAQSSELKSFYNSVSETFKQAQEMISIRQDLGAELSYSPKGKRTGLKLFSFGLDSSNQFSPTLTLAEKIKVSYEPLSDQIFAQVGWDF